jgi:hypothetical protein
VALSALLITVSGMLLFAPDVPPPPVLRARELRIPEARLSLYLDPAREQPLETPFKLAAGALWIGTRCREGESLLRPDPEGVFLADGESALYVDDLNRLKGRVQITSPEQALAFVRLLTSPRTWHAMAAAKGGGSVEVISAPRLSQGFFFGDRRPLTTGYTSPFTSGMGGIFGATDARRFRLQPARVQTTPAGFEIRRTLYRDEQVKGSERLLDVVEEVSGHGRYARRVLRVRKAPKGFYVCLPRRE